MNVVSRFHVPNFNSIGFRFDTSPKESILIECTEPHDDLYFSVYENTELHIELNDCADAATYVGLIPEQRR